MTAAMQNVSFTGVGGTPVVLNINGDRMESYEVINYVLEAGDAMSSVAVGIYDSHSTEQQYRAYERAVVWPGNSTKVPTSGIVAGHGQW